MRMVTLLSAAAFFVALGSMSVQAQSPAGDAGASVPSAAAPGPAGGVGDMEAGGPGAGGPESKLPERRPVALRVAKAKPE
jgi:hypothetical protein